MKYDWTYILAAILIIVVAVVAYEIVVTFGSCATHFVPSR
jgi:hypothetical protein